MANLFSQPQLTPIIRWLSLSFLISALSKVQEAIFRRNLAFKTLAIRSLVAVVAGGLCGVIMAFMGFGVWSLVGQQLTNGLVQILVLWWASDWRPGLNVSLRHFRELFSFGINVLVMNILEYINIRADDFLIGYFLGPVALGYYSIAYRLMMIVLDLLTNTMNQVAIPLFSRLQKEPERMREAFYRVAELASLVSFPIFFGLAALAPELIRVLFGAKWLPSIPVIQILSFIGVLHSVSYFNGTVIMAMGKPSWKVMVNFIYSIANLVAFIAVVRWGIVAVAAAYVIRGYVLLPPIEMALVSRLIHTNLSTYVRRLIAPLTASLAMVIAIWMVKHFITGFVSLYVLLSVSVVIGAFVYIVTILMVAPKLVRQVLDLAQLVLPIRTKKS
jgi:PST family polysaccharide transporter